MSDYLSSLKTLQLQKIHSGKVRDSFRLNDRERLIFVSDRISAFDRVLKTPVPMKGAVLNKITNYWFENTGDIIRNHFIKEVDPNISVVKEVTPIRVEMVVRGYLTGSMWRYYQQGKRTFSGIVLPDDLCKNQKFPEPILTPTTKEESDREITPAEIVSSGLATSAVYEKMHKAAIDLYSFGAEKLAASGIILVDTKYEFGLDGDEVILIDEIHTPDASRFWRAEDYHRHQKDAEQIDKEFVRQWLIANKSEDGEYPSALPQEIISETTKRYLAIYNLVTGQNLDMDLSLGIKQRVAENLAKAGICKMYSAVLFDDGKIAPEFIEQFTNTLAAVNYSPFIKSVKNSAEIVAILTEMQDSLETIIPLFSGASIASESDMKAYNGVSVEGKTYAVLNEELSKRCV